MLRECLIAKELVQLSICSLFNMSVGPNQFLANPSMTLAMRTFMLDAIFQHSSTFLCSSVSLKSSIFIISLLKILSSQTSQFTMVCMIFSVCQFLSSIMAVIGVFATFPQFLRLLLEINGEFLIYLGKATSFNFWAKFGTFSGAYQLLSNFKVLLL